MIRRASRSGVAICRAQTGPGAISDVDEQPALTAGAVNVLLTSAVNGLLFGVVLGVISLLIPRRR